MPTISSVVLEVPDPAAAEAFYATAFGLGPRIGVRRQEAPATAFRGFTLSLIVGQPSTVDALLGSALEAGATALKPAKKGLWGYGGVVQAPDGAVWKVATSSKKETGPATRAVDEVVLLLGVEDVKASKRFHADRGLTVAKSFGGRYAEFEAPSSAVKLALLGRAALTKDAGVPADGSGPRGIAILSDTAPATDPDGFSWEAASA